MTVIAGIDVGHATTEVVLMSGGKILGAGRVPTRGRKGVRGLAARRRRAGPPGRTLGPDARPPRPGSPPCAADTSVVTVPDVAPPRGRLRVLAAGVAAPGGTGACVGPPLLLAAADLPAGSPVPAADPPAGSPSHWVPG